MKVKFCTLFFSILVLHQVIFAREFQVISDEGFIRQRAQIIGKYKIGTVFNSIEVISEKVFTRINDGRIGWIGRSELEEIYQEDWQLGDVQLEVGDQSSKDLQVKSNGVSSLRSKRFVSRAEGVNFEGVFNESYIKESGSFGIYYDEEGRDGERLVLIYANEIVIVPIADWILVPVSKFVNDEYTVLISLFGDGPARESNYYIEYHSALKNTLLGLRLLQADMMLMAPQKFAMPMKQRGKEILGKFEKHSTGRISEDLIHQVYQIIERSDRQSWVLMDISSQKDIKLIGSELLYFNQPYYYFWKSDERAEQEYNSLLQTYNKLVDRYNRSAEEYNDQAQRASLGATKSQIQELNAKEAGIEQMVVNLEKLKTRLSKDSEVIPLKSTNKLIRENWDLLVRLNPNVYNAVEKTASLIALLNYYKKYHSRSWKKFVQTIQDVQVIPKVYSPTQVAKGLN